MNLQELLEQLTDAIAACEREGISPTTVAVRGVTQPHYPLYHGITNAGFVRSGGETTPWLALAADGDDGYATEADFQAELDIPPADEDDCGACGWEQHFGDCVNPDCEESSV